MLSIEKLHKVKTLICHKDCADGMASAMILRSALPDAEVVFMQYNTPEFSALKAAEGQLWCDFSPPADRYMEFVEAGAIVLDHHKSAKTIVAAFGEDGVFADEKEDPGVSGALLAYRHVWEPLSETWNWSHGSRPKREYVRIIERLAVLAGIRDTWQRQSPDWTQACAQAEALRFWPAEEWIEEDVWGWEKMIAIGPTLLARHAAKVEKVVKSGYRFTSHGGKRVIVFQGVSATSDAAEKLKDEVDLVVGFLYLNDSEGLQVTYSMRSQTGFDCAKMAKEHGGGGHTGAAGFSHRFESNAQNQGYKDPFYLFLVMLDVHEQGRQWGGGAKCIVCGKAGATYPLAGMMYHETEGCHPKLTQEQYDRLRKGPKVLELALRLRDHLRRAWGKKPDA